MASRNRHVWIFICCALALFVLIFFEPAYGWRVREWLSPERGMAQAGAQAAQTQDESLQSQLAQLQSVMAQMPQNPQGEIRAMVYLQYPFGFKNELLVNAGSNEGVVVGKAVTFQEIFVGTVIQVFPESAVVQTVFDPGFKMPVRIGGQSSGGQNLGGGSAGSSNNASIDALLVGGADPKATSIAKNAAVANGDIIYTAAPGLPYGLPIGTANATTISADNLFQEASLNFAYDVNDIQTVLIAR